MLFTLPLLAWLLPAAALEMEPKIIHENVNLALRRTADGLLRLSGDSTSRIPVVEQTSANVWRLRLEQTFSYDKLPALLQESFDMHEIHTPYHVAIRSCTTSEIVLGYHQMDLVNDQEVPCGSREMPEGCQEIEITFLDAPKKWPQRLALSGVLLLLVGGMAGFWLAKRRKTAVLLTQTPEQEADWLHFGHSRLDAAGQMLYCGSTQTKLTFREAKLLRLFAENKDRLLEREHILQQVWADEGVLVGRSIDVFVSRLRKKTRHRPKPKYRGSAWRRV